ncbi:hypothetical protein B0T19DRAFT_151298 [Cercophora scortea]|uniref:Uncharacterized protein n=1 Tax=Cercophora scortea TaxID=314031 RepID=A0AAE0IL03_9PEZI|nr:hypothetical protein B0T19DRAFT_151298 [Cercophora scortea]
MSSPKPDAEEPEWLKLLQEHADFDDQHITCIIETILIQYLLSSDADATTTTAGKYDALYGEVYEPKFNGYAGTKKGWSGYLSLFYGTLFRIVDLIPYDDPTQDKIVQLVVELKKLPPHACKIWNKAEFEWVDSLVWAREPILAWELLKQEEMYPPHDEGLDWSDPSEVSDYEEGATAWVNYHAFAARCVAAGLNEGFKHRFDNPAMVIALGLDPDYRPAYKKLDCHVMAAAQYLTIAAEVIDAECVRKQLPPNRHHDWTGWADGKGPSVWKRWGDRLKEIADAIDGGGELGFRLQDKNKEVVKDMVTRARQTMVALEPELFAEGKTGTAE